MRPSEPAAALCDTFTSCPGCAGTSLRTLPVPGHWIGGEAFAALRGRIGLVRCRGCGLVFTNPRPSGARLSAYYAGDAYVCHDTAGSASAGAKAAFLLDRIERHLPSGVPRTLLDYGAGGGGFLLHARSRGWSARGFEPGRRGLESCRRLGLDVTADASDLPVGAFGLVTLHHVFEHLPNPAEVLRDIGVLLAPGGRLFVEVPNARSLRARLALPLLSRRFGVDERYRAFPIHLVYHSASTLRAMFERSGWEVEAAFTLGLGVDEFFTSRGSAGGPAPPGRGPDRTAPRRRVRHIVRDAFLGLGLGENLAVIARPGAR